MAVDDFLGIRGVCSLFQRGERYSTALAMLAVPAEDVGPNHQAELTKDLFEVHVGCVGRQVGYEQVVSLLIKF